MDDKTHYWFRQARDWRKRARAAELHAEKLARRTASLDRSVSEHREAFMSTLDCWRQQVDEAHRVRRCIEDAKRVLLRYHRGTNGKEMQQIVNDALAFLRVAHPSPDGGKQ